MKLGRYYLLHHARIFCFVLFYKDLKICIHIEQKQWLLKIIKQENISTIPHKNIETNEKFYRKVAFLMYTEMG